MRRFILFPVIVCLVLSLPAQISFTTTVIDNGDYYEMVAHDFDLDGDVDIVALDFSPDNIYYFERAAGVYSTIALLDYQTEAPKTMDKADFNGDGFMDIVVGFNLSDEIFWYPNTGGSFGTPQLITNSAQAVERVRTGDVDGDGDMDVVAANPHDDQVVWYENDLAGSGIWTTHIVTSTVDNPNDVAIGDIDGDGDLDLAQASVLDGTFSWFENLGGGIYGPENILSSSFPFARSVEIADFDGDGNLDVAGQTSAANQVLWFRNENKTGFSSGVIISTAINAGRRLDIGDMDNDGDIDLLSSSSLDGKFAWYENLGGSFGAQHIISTGFPAAYYLKAVDLDNDGDLDVIGGSTNTGAAQLVVFENQLINSCPVPVALNQIPTSSSVTLEWDEDIDHTGFQIRGAKSGSSPANIFTASSPWSTSAIDPLTDYLWKIRAQCTGGMISAWSSLQTFTTPLRLSETGLAATLYPNPVSDILYIEAMAGQVEIVNSVGQTVMIWDNVEPGSMLKADMTQLANGLYFVVQKGTDGTRQNNQIVVEH